jgi:acyl-CoA reductase-like NAD-dependent aldehyde dehydrogenase
MPTADAPSHHKQFLATCRELSVLIQGRRKELAKLLGTYETYETIQDEIQRSINALDGAGDEFANILDPLEGLTIATFFPLNMPLYSLVIFGILPSAFANHVYLRPPEVMHGILRKLWQTLHIAESFPVLSLQATPRHIFVDLYAAESDVIIFTGRYENALAIHAQCPYSLLIYNGSGINPFLVFENADLELAVEKAVEMRCFNSGQDCAGPDAFFVPRSLADKFTARLKAELENVKVGDTTDPEVRVGRTMKEAYITELEQWFAKERPYLVYGGVIDKERRLVHPTIVRKNVTEHTEEGFHEFFAPFFYVLEYDNEEDLTRLLTSAAFREHSMYVSVFGNNPQVEKQLTSVRILRNVIVNDVEQGNEEYGGYGARSNFLLYGDKRTVQPILISRDMHATLHHAEQPAFQPIG